MKKPIEEDTKFATTKRRSGNQGVDELTITLYCGKERVAKRLKEWLEHRLSSLQATALLGIASPDGIVVVFVSILHQTVQDLIEVLSSGVEASIDITIRYSNPVFDNDGMEHEPETLFARR